MKKFLFLFLATFCSGCMNITPELVAAMARDHSTVKITINTPWGPEIFERTNTWVIEPSTQPVK